MHIVPSSTDPEALIIGGGPAGAAMGIHLARRGRAVEIIEQNAAMQHKVCGEFLSHEAASYLNQLGVDVHDLGAIPIHGVRLIGRTRVAECELPFPAMSITRRRLDEALLSAAVSEGAVVLRGRRAESLEKSQTGWKVRLAGGESRKAKDAFLATGKHDLRGHRRPPGKQNDLVAFKMYFRVTPAQQRELQGWVDLVVFHGGYAGMLLTEDGHANLCLVVQRQVLRQLGNGWAELLAWIGHFSDQFAQRLADAEALLPKPLALSSIPYGLLMRGAEPGLWRLGDQAAVIPSFSGDGVSIALHSAQLAADFYLNGGSSAQLADRLVRDLRGSIRLATTLSRLMVAAPGLAPLVQLWPPFLRYFADQTRVPRTAIRSEGIMHP